MFCVECGQEKPIHKNGLCLSCYLKENTFSRGPQVIDIHTCAHCESLKYKHTWMNEPLPTFLRRTIANHFSIQPELKNTRITTDCTLNHKTNKCTVTITGTIDNQTVSEEHPLTIRIKQTTCPTCSRQRGGYYESILQVRGEQKLSPQILQDIQHLIESYINEQQNKGNTSQFITEIAPEHGGLDFYLSEKNLGHSLAKKIYEQYGGSMQQSSKNIGMKDGRQLYRMTYLIRLPKFHESDIIKQNNNFYLISNIKGNKISTINLSTWKKTVFELSKLQNPKVFSFKETKQKMIIVSESPNEIHLMHPKSYKSTEIKKPKKGFSFSKDTIFVIKINDEIFLNPE